MQIIQANSVPSWNNRVHYPLKDKSVQLVVTSPPYFNVRIYGGSELEYGNQSLGVYLRRWQYVAEELWRVMDDEACLFINIGDKAAGSGGAGGDYNKGGSKAGRPKYYKADTGLPDGGWCNVPARMAIAMQDMKDEEGKHLWRLRSEIIWDKGRLEVCDGKHIRRPKVAHEWIYMFTKNLGKIKDYRFDFDKLEEKGTVWHFPPNATGDKGFAPFPDDLPRRCIDIASKRGDRVFDPFVGSDTTIRVAEEMGRLGIGMDLYATV